MKNSPLLFEVTGKEFIQFAQNINPVTQKRAKLVNVVKFLGFLSNDTLLFQTNAVTTKYTDKWFQRIKVEFKKPGKTEWQTVLNALMGDIKIHCNCPAFRYWGGWYEVGAFGSLIGKRTFIEPTTNYRKEQGICKHLYSVLLALPGNLNLITRDFKIKKIVTTDADVEIFDKSKYKIKNK